MNNRTRRAFILFGCLIGAAIPAAGQESASIAASADTGLFELDANFNLGAQRDVASGTLGPFGDRARSRALFRFSLEGLVPADAAILEASLELYVTRTPPSGNRIGSTFALHRMLKPWNEGDKRGDNPGGAPATAGEVTWAQLAEGERDWGTPGGRAGDDYAGVSSGERRLNGEGQYSVPLNEIGLADLRGWLDDPETNFGWALISRSEDTAYTARRAATREAREEERRPNLIVSFTQPSPLLLTVVERRPDSFVIGWNSETGATYQVQLASALANPQWQAVGDPIAGDGTEQNLQIALNPDSPSSYFRIVKGP